MENPRDFLFVGQVMADEHMRRIEGLTDEERDQTIRSAKNDLRERLLVISKTAGELFDALEDEGINLAFVQKLSALDVTVNNLQRNVVTAYVVSGGAGTWIMDQIQKEFKEL